MRSRQAMSVLLVRPGHRGGVLEVPGGDRRAARRAGLLQGAQVGGQLVDQVTQVGVLEAGAHLADRAPGGIAYPGALGGRREVAQALLGGGERVQRRAGEEPVQHEELDDPRRLERAAVGTQKGLVGAAGPQDGAPVTGTVTRQQLYRQQPRGHVGPFQAATEDEEAPRLVPAHRRLGEPGQHRRAFPHEAQEQRRAEALGRPAPARQGGPGDVEAFPHLAGDGLPGAARALPGGDDRTGDGARVVDVEGQPLQRVAGGEARLAGAVDAEDRQQRTARRVLVGPRVLQQPGEERVEDARGVVGPLDVPADPEQRLGDAAQHYCCPPIAAPPVSLGATSCGTTSTGPVAERWRDGGSARSAASTQVSLEPPPWLELTTSAPSGSATRVSPPGSSQTSLPSLMANGRRSMWRGATSLPISVGDVDSATGRWAIQPRGSAATVTRRASNVDSSACGPMTIPLPPAPSTGLRTRVSRWDSAWSSTSGSSSRCVSTFGMTGSSCR